jgi:cytidylate kinase
MIMPINVAIDGPSGAGKSTIAKEIAKQLNYIYVDTGAMYRALAYACVRAGVVTDDEVKIWDVCKNADVTIVYQNGEQIVLLNDENVNPYIRTEEVSRMASKVSAYPKIREKLLDLQQRLAREQNVIMDGRDIGSTVLPNANPKIYLTASVEARAKRRYEQNQELGEVSNLEDIKKDIEERDYRDTHRECSPLTVAEGAIIVDSSEMSIAEVVQKIKDCIQEVAG